MEKFKLLRGGVVKQRVYALPEVARVFFALQKQKSAGRNAQSFSHCDDRV